MTFVAIPLFFFTAFFEKSVARDEAYPIPTPHPQNIGLRQRYSVQRITH